MPVRTARGDRTRGEILAAARALILETGPGGLSMREVARKSGLAPSALYNHFDGKEALVNELAMEAVGALGGYLREVPDGRDVGQALRALGTQYLRFASEEPVRYRLVFDLLEVPSRHWADFVGVAYPFTLIVATVETGLASGRIVDISGVGAAGIAYGFWSLVHGMVMLSAHHLARIEDDLSALQTAAIDAYVAGITSSHTHANERKSKE